MSLHTSLSDLHIADWTPITGACDVPCESCVTGVTLSRGTLSAVAKALHTTKHGCSIVSAALEQMLSLISYCTAVSRDF